MPDLINARQFLVSCAVREAFRHDFDVQRTVADELARVAADLGVDERTLIFRDLRAELGYYSDAERPDLWDPAINAVYAVHAGVNDERGRDHPIPVDQRVVVIGAVRYALGRNTYICGMVAEELARVAGNLGADVRDEIVTEIESGLREVTPSDIRADWRQALTKLSVPSF